MQLVVTQCCKSKSSLELFPSSIDLLSRIPRTRSIVERGRCLFQQHVYGTKPVTALSLYVGHEYRALDKQLVYRRLAQGSLDLLIISACYGVVHGPEKASEYELAMDRRVASTWLKLGLPQVLEEYVARLRPRRVYGLFTKTCLLYTSPSPRDRG